MSEEEIIRNLYEILIKSKISQRKLAKLLGTTGPNLSLLMRRIKPMCENRKRLFEIGIRLYNEGKLFN